MRSLHGIDRLHGFASGGSSAKTKSYIIPACCNASADSAGLGSTAKVARVSDTRTSAIKPSTTAQNHIFERCLEFLDAINFLPGLNQHIFRHPQSAQAPMRPLRTADGGFIAVWHDHQEVNVTILVRLAPGM